MEYFLTIPKGENTSSDSIQEFLSSRGTFKLRGGFETKRFQQIVSTRRVSTERRSYICQVKWIFSSVMSRPESILIRPGEEDLLIRQY